MILNKKKLVKAKVNTAVVRVPGVNVPMFLRAFFILNCYTIGVIPRSGGPPKVDNCGQPILLKKLHFLCDI